MISAKAYAAATSTSPFAPFALTRREPGPHDVLIDIKYCGICHSDLHAARNEWGGQPFPCVPGHEVAGIVASVGSEVTGFKVGDRVGVGCMVDSCGECDPCKRGLEMHCDNGVVWTYGTRKVYGEHDPDTDHTYGGYSTAITVKDRFVVKIPEALPLDSAAPLLCAGITMYSPLKRYGAGPGKRVGIVGLGGLGHVGVKIAHAMGAHVTLITTSPSKAADAASLGADGVIVSTDPEQMQKALRTLDLIVDTVSAAHDMDAYMNLIRLEGALVMVGLPPEKLAIKAGTLASKRRIFTGSNIGGIAETQEMLDFCAAHGVTADIELIEAKDINAAYERLVKADVRYRFVIDSATIG
ncbi:MAG TPA: NAD(P)-dependent alcohol dehydrogenase [Devosiaceae bacterium]|nr:NAD(P)-dependent alcohol dehydrogenase [Devosiaceae bacterium]